MRKLSGQSTCVQFDDYDTDPESVAQFIRRNGSMMPEIILVGYSWGGDCAVDVCWKLDDLGLEVEHLLLCDAVYRSSLKTMAWRALTSSPKLKIPDNVAEVTWFYQRRNKPAGHVPVAVDPYNDFDKAGTVIHPGKQLDMIHAAMDEAPEFIDAAVRIAGAAA